MTNDKTTRKHVRYVQDVGIVTNPDALLTVETVCALVGCKPDTVRAWVKVQKFPPPVHLGRNQRWRSAVVTDWLRSRD
jgi:predicted DNA-binding transcriptional regulator AlpA